VMFSAPADFTSMGIVRAAPARFGIISSIPPFSLSAFF
jgi:hypothetical protein